jgi:hypothetical protein
MLLRLKDGKGGQAIQYVNVELVPTNIPPIFTSLVPENPKAQVGKAFYYQAIAQDPDGDRLTYSLSSPPEGMTITDGIIAWESTAPPKQVIIT